VAEIAFLLDANISSDMLSQVEMLAKGLNDSPDLRARVVVVGTVASACTVARRYKNLWASGDDTAGGLSLYHLPSPRGLAPLDILDLARSEALAGCSLLHCFSLSLLNALVSLPAGKLLPAWCLSLSCWPGERAIRQLGRQSRSPPRRVICFTAFLQEALVAAGIPAEQCSVIPPELPIQEKAPGRLAARKQLSMPEDTELLLADSQISCSSNQQQLIWAAAIIGQFRPRLRVLLGGSDPSLVRLRAFDDSLNPPSLGIYPAEKFDPQVLYAASDLLVLPATGAISPLPLLRAARVRLPVVASDSRAFRQYLRHEANALLFSPNRHSPGDPTRQRIRPLAGAIVRLLEDRSFAKRLAEQLTRDICNVFPPGRALPAHLELYQRILG